MTKRQGLALAVLAPLAGLALAALVLLVVVLLPVIYEELRPSTTLTAQPAKK
jgi:hypothetical protein